MLCQGAIKPLEIVIFYITIIHWCTFNDLLVIYRCVHIMILVCDSILHTFWKWQIKRGSIHRILIQDSLRCNALCGVDYKWQLKNVVHVIPFLLSHATFLAQFIIRQLFVRWKRIVALLEWILTVHKPVQHYRCCPHIWLIIVIKFLNSSKFRWHVQKCSYINCLRSGIIFIPCYTKIA